jgi:hypothetical protein
MKATQDFLIKLFLDVLQLYQPSGPQTDWQTRQDHHEGEWEGDVPKIKPSGKWLIQMKQEL